MESTSDSAGILARFNKLDESLISLTSVVDTLTTSLAPVLLAPEERIDKCEPSLTGSDMSRWLGRMDADLFEQTERLRDIITQLDM